MSTISVSLRICSSICLRSLDTLLPYFFLVSWNRLISLPSLALLLCSSVSSRRS